MITGNIHHIDPQLYDYPGFRQALSYLAALEQFPPVGQADIDREEVFASVQSYDTKPHGDIPWECHREYIDIQFVYSGREKVGVAPVTGISGFDYDQANDIAFTQDKTEGEWVPLEAGDFVVLFPEDAHRPRGYFDDAPEAVQKIVVKVRYSRQ